MMNTKAMTLKVDDDGTLTIPVDLARTLRLSPHQTITVEAREDALVLVPSPRPRSAQTRKDRLQLIGHLLRTALVGVEWAQIESGRRDRWF